MSREQPTGNGEQRHGEQGYLLLGALVAVAIVLIFLSVAATYVARDLKREREEETVRRARQYIRAIQLYYRKFGHYPGSMDQLEHTNNIRFLRKKYVDPLTGTTDWRLILVGKNKTTVKGFFGQPLAGMATTGLGALAGSQSPGIGGPAGANTTTGPAAALGAPAIGPTTGNGTAASGPTGATATAGPGATGATPGAAGATAPGAAGQPGAGGTGTNSAASPSPFGSSSTGMFMGVGTNATGSSIVEVNEQTAYQDWEFLYDPRLEQLKQAAAMNAGIGSTNASQLGQPASNANPATGTASGAASSGEAAPGTATPPNPGSPTPGSTAPPADPNQPNSSPRPPNNVGVPVQP